MKITWLNIKYRGFQIGYIKNPLGYRPAFRSSLESKNAEGHIVVDTVCEIEKLAKDCIDYQYRVEVAEHELGRKLTLNELRPDL